jgi:Na+-transporting methylmalonyl-CoA/oxaloacetate decarboxylase gamma subunit
VGVGVVVGLLSLLAFARMMDSLAPKRYTESKIIDVKVVEPSNDEKK